MNALNGSLSLSLPALFPDGWLCSFSIVVDKGGRPSDLPVSLSLSARPAPSPSVRREGAAI